MAEDGSITHFRYLAFSEERAVCVTYLAEIPNKTDAKGGLMKVVIKFVASYSEKAHELLAPNGCVPTSDIAAHYLAIAGDALALCWACPKQNKTTALASA